MAPYLERQPNALPGAGLHHATRSPMHVPRSVTVPVADAAAPASMVAVRVLETASDLAACVELQREIWGLTYGEFVPASLMRAAARVGGLMLGAVAASGELVGFVFGLTGVVSGEVVHWSHMLGVRHAWRDRGLGRLLKERQRTELASRGIARMCWTFDPLQARNAHLNINRLGARVVEYVRDMYGASRSPLHQAGTDRVVVECATSSSTIPSEVEFVIDPMLPVLTAQPRPTDAAVAGLPSMVLIEIPYDVLELATPADVVQWRETTRRSFEWALSQGYTVLRVQRDAAARRVFYVLGRGASDGRVVGDLTTGADP